MQLLWEYADNGTSGRVTQEGTELLIGNYGDIFCEENTVTVRPYEAFVLKMK